MTHLLLYQSFQSLYPYITAYLHISYHRKYLYLEFTKFSWKRISTGQSCSKHVWFPTVYFMFNNKI